jgi:hypothetical protein
LSDIIVTVGDPRANDGTGHATVTVYSKCGEVVFNIPVALAVGTGGKDRTVTNADTPFGVYRYDDYHKGKRVEKTPDAYGNGQVHMHPVYGEVADAGRDGIWLHGGGTGLKDPYAPRQELIHTHGCVRCYNEEVVALIDVIQAMKDRGDPVRFVYVGDDAYLDKLADDNGSGYPLWRDWLRFLRGRMDGYSLWTRRRYFGCE